MGRVGWFLVGVALTLLVEFVGVLVAVSITQDEPREAPRNVGPWPAAGSDVQQRATL